ncbi:ABC transporter substrate-binding protein [Bosea sp. (in: a-proteobacteria)]|uniref:ABC transporter substrate-binding protein n=1 Tax=Bosea sp. (in: a-proteobacteria) TaxID=1871050 RepID=UPI002615BCB8|nr:extracellular solute-binding protein [Bosea sp. (in: a-proteobacteria)]MCO5090614.1 extracellular solute-binding protein [Bosea sp. (in: a-proteobacteria)]
MTALSRRQFTLGALAAGASYSALIEHCAAQAAAAAATRNLPRTHAGKTVKVVWGNTPAYVAAAEVAKEFTAASGINVEFSALPTAERYQKMVLDTTTNTNSFDIYLVAYQWKEQVAPFVIDHTNMDKEVAGIPAPDWSDYAPRALAAYSKVGDKLATIPINGDTSFTVWSKEAFQKAGLDPEQAPTTWKQLVENGHKLKQGDQYGYNMPAGKTIQTGCVWITLFHSFGGQYFDQAGKPLLDSKASVEAFRYMKEQLGPISPPGNLTWDFPEMIAALSSGQAAQGYMWTGGVSALYDPTKSRISKGVGYAPTPETVLLGGWGLSVGSKSRSLDAAKLFLGWFTSPEIVKQTALLGLSPVRRSALLDPDTNKKFPYFPSVLKGMEGSVATYAPIKDAEQVNIQIYDEANAVCSGTKTPEEGAAALQERVTTLMKRRGYFQ